MSEPSSAKRKRVEADCSETPGSAPIRSKIWKPFGDIILQAESTQFRVSRDILAEQSSVFRDMFGVPQPPNEPTIEGCPIVHVSDTAQDWELLLEVLYKPFDSAVSRPFPVVAAMLRLGKKYEMEAPKEDALRRIHTECPTTLEKIDSIQGSETLWSVITREHGLAMSLLNLAYECGVYSAIPTLALRCFPYKLEKLATVVSLDRFAILAIAHERITVFQTESLSWLHGQEVIPHKSCKSSTVCRRKQKAVCYTNAGQENYGYPGYTLSEWKHGPWVDKFCDVCDTAAREAYETYRQKGWELLPTFFGLGKWEDLKDAD
ncbi:hypothetical protein C8R46DRAFT_387761 [Mycena filopes]|nr:hypothetical protein C8R46DRAFT_387761 [Mycena filopes]